MGYIGTVAGFRGILAEFRRKYGAVTGHHGKFVNSRSVELAPARVAHWSGRKEPPGKP